MAKLTRANQEIFAVSAPAGLVRQFGSLAEGSPLTTTDPEVIQALATRYDIGWQAAAVTSGEGNIVPALEDFNALFFLITYQLFYLFEQGIAEWDDATTYYINSIVRSGSILYKSLTDTNLNNDPTGDIVNWNVYYGANEETATSTTPYTIADEDTLSVDCTAGDKVVNIPTPVGVNGRKIKIMKSDTSVNKVTITPAAGTINGNANAFLFAQYNYIEFISNGTIWIVSDSWVKKIFDIGDWNMDTTVSVSVAHGIDFTQIRSASIFIQDDGSTTFSDLIRITGATGVVAGGGAVCDATNVILERTTGGAYDNASYDSTSFNRGYITLEFTMF
ncbi:hypothetical protein KAR91_59470 [Candidatus Pacearchaeota archaeon]|nr:hypothetical protein [Candidatus Pacearchaeota archaeon]